MLKSNESNSTMKALSTRPRTRTSFSRCQSHMAEGKWDGASRRLPAPPAQPWSLTSQDWENMGQAPTRPHLRYRPLRSTSGFTPVRGAGPPLSAPLAFCHTGRAGTEHIHPLRRVLRKPECSNADTASPSSPWSRKILIHRLQTTKTHRSHLSQPFAGAWCPQQPLPGHVRMENWKSGHLRVFQGYPACSTF